MAKLINKIAQKSILPVSANLQDALLAGVSGKWTMTVRSRFSISKPFQAILLLLVVGLCSCHSKRMPDPPATILALQNMQELATVEYTVTKVVKANDNKNWYTVGDRKILMTCQASIKAGIDLSQLQPADVQADGKSIRIHLPPPQLLSVNLPPENIKVAYSEVGVLRSDFTSAEKDALMAQAQQQITVAANQPAMLDQAKLNTQTFFTHFLQQLGFEQIQLSFDKPPTRRIE